MLRKATRQDMMRIFQIRNTVEENRLPHSYEDYAEVAGPFVDAGFCWVWEENKQVWGEAGYNPDAGYIEVLYVDPAAQGRGIGTALLDKCCCEIKALGHSHAFVSTSPKTMAEVFYARKGWRACNAEGNGDIRFKKALTF